ncbi:MAG: hypothetical protein ACXVQS_09215 [Actinomycetota bacterium]
MLFLAAAIATFLAGVFSTGLQMIGVSIGCSAAAALLLLGGVLRDSRRRPTVAPAGLSMPARDIAAYVAPSLPEESFATEPQPELEPEPEPLPAYEEPSYQEPAYEERTATQTIDLDAAREEFFGTPAESYDVEEEPASEPIVTPSKPAARKPAVKKPAARKLAAKTTKAPAKPAARKTAVKPAAKTAKTAAKTVKPAAKTAKTAAKSTAKKAAPRKLAARKPRPGNES